MYIGKPTGYYRGSEQCMTRADFLMLIEPKVDTFVDKTKYPIKALVRKAALQQFGHFMMGYVRAYGLTLVVSGSYGADGLVMRVPMEVYNRAKMTLPQELYDAWANGGGHNSCGTEANMMREWALQNLNELKR